MAGTRGRRRADRGRRRAGGQSAAAPPPAGCSHQEGSTPPHQGSRSGGRDPAPASLEPAIRRPLASVRAPRQGHRRRGGDSPRAGGNPRRRPRAARRWRPGPWLRPGAGARVPVPRCQARRANPRHQRALALSALDCQRLVTWVPASPTPDSDALSNRPYLRFQGRAPPTSGRERSAQDPYSGIQLCAAAPDPDSEPRAPGDERQ